MDSNNIFFKIVVGVVLVGYMAFIFYQSLKVGLAYKKEFENFKTFFHLPLYYIVEGMEIKCFSCICKYLL